MGILKIELSCLYFLSTSVSFPKMVKLFFVLLVALVTYVEVRGDHKCDNLGVLLYEEIGCKPVKDKPDDLCPSSYDCSHLQEKGEFCFFQGKKYKNRESLPENATSGTCNGGCFCEASFDGLFSKFTCAAYDCPEFLGGNPLQSPQCIRTYGLDSCCASGQICPPFDNIATCKVDRQVLKEGQKFYPQNTCLSCVCGKEFAGKYEAPFCKRHNCVAELRHSQDIKANCAPAYGKDVRCCPSLWVCPLETDIFSPAEKNEASSKTCKFGEKEIKAGQTLKRTVEQYGSKHEMKCDCQLPPLLTCIIEHSEPIKN